MIKRILLVILVALLATPAFAGPWTVGQQTITYTDAHPLGAPNTAPAYAYQEAEVADNFTASTWIHSTGTFVGGGGQFDAPGVGSEGKARFDCNIAFENHNDPILAPGVAGGATHDHSFFGNLAAATNTHLVTYASLRAAGNSTCYGGPLNRSLYWEPSMKKVLTNGATVTVKPQNIVTYYEIGALAKIGDGSIDDPLKGSIWPRGLNFIEGFNMSDPTNSRVTSIVAALNAAAGWAKYSTVGNSTGGGFVGWFCGTPASGAGSGGAIATSPNPSGPYQPWLRNSDNSPTLDCAANSPVFGELLSDPCWDGVNLTSPDGRGHMMPFIRDNNSSKLVCPDNWYRVVQFRAKVAFFTKNQADHTNWWVASDRMSGMTQFRNGESMHFDLIPAWSYGTAASPGVFIKFAVNCNGQPVTQAATGGTTASLAGNGHECGYGRIKSDEQLFVNEASPDGSSPNPIVNLAPDHTGIGRYFPATTGTAIPGTIHHSH